MPLKNKSQYVNALTFDNYVKFKGCRLMFIQRFQPTPR